MPRKIFTPEQIFCKLWEAEVLMVQDQSAQHATLQIGVLEQTDYRPKIPDDEHVVSERMIQFATRFGRYGYLRITAMLRNEGLQVNHKQVK